jgi:hypothetical protein
VYEEPVVWAGVTFSHYGHFAVESVGRLWPVLPGAELEGLPVVTPGLPWGKTIHEWINAFGARRIEPPEDSVIRFKHMYVPEPAWQVDAWVAPEIRDIHLQVRHNLRIKRTPQHGVLWLSRSRMNRERRAYDECLLEWVLADHVKMFHPETASLAEQIAAIESSNVVAGVVGSAFHSLLTAETLPRCIYLCPGTDVSHGSMYEPQGAYVVQDQLLNVNGKFLYVCAPTGVKDYCFPGGKHLTFPGGHRILVPETLRALREVALPDLFDDPRALALAYPSRSRRGAGSEDSGSVAAAATMLRNPFSADARLEAGLAFEAEGLTRCALEQFMTAADLASDPVQALHSAARVLVDEGVTSVASAVTERALAIDPGSRAVGPLGVRQ